MTGLRYGTVIRWVGDAPRLGEWMLIAKDTGNGGDPIWWCLNLTDTYTRLITAWWVDAAQFEIVE